MLTDRTAASKRQDFEALRNFCRTDFDILGFAVLANSPEINRQFSPANSKPSSPAAPRVSDVFPRHAPADNPESNARSDVVSDPPHPRARAPLKLRPAPRPGSQNAKTEFPCCDTKPILRIFRRGAISSQHPARRRRYQHAFPTKTKSSSRRPPEPANSRVPCAQRAPFVPAIAERPQLHISPAHCRV